MTKSKRGITPACQEQQRKKTGSTYILCTGHFSGPSIWVLAPAAKKPYGQTDGQTDGQTGPNQYAPSTSSKFEGGGGRGGGADGQTDG